MDTKEKVKEKIRTKSCNRQYKTNASRFILTLLENSDLKKKEWLSFIFGDEESK